MPCREDLPNFFGCSFLATLLDATGSKRTLALGLLGHLVASLLVWGDGISKGGWVSGVSHGCVPEACLSLWALSSSSSSVTFFLGFLLWMGLVPALVLVSRRRYSHCWFYVLPCPEGMFARIYGRVASENMMILLVDSVFLARGWLTL